jgi:hypothetical protein
MSMLYSKIKFEIDIINDKKLKTIREQMREIKTGESGEGEFAQVESLPKDYIYDHTI